MRTKPVSRVSSGRQGRGISQVDVKESTQGHVKWVKAMTRQFVMLTGDRYPYIQVAHRRHSELEGGHDFVSRDPVHNGLGIRRMAACGMFS
jgi:hypothetical protein